MSFYCWFVYTMIDLSGSGRVLGLLDSLVYVVALKISYSPYISFPSLFFSRLLVYSCLSQVSPFASVCCGQHLCLEMPSANAIWEAAFSCQMEPPIFLPLCRATYCSESQLLTSLASHPSTSLPSYPHPSVGVRAVYKL